MSRFFLQVKVLRSDNETQRCIYLHAWCGCNVRIFDFEIVVFFCPYFVNSDRAFPTKNFNLRQMVLGQIYV